MSFAICTFIEDHYHFGVAGLANSVYKRGFRGSMFVGYRGKLPEWASPLKENTLIEWNGSRTREVLEGMQIHFLPIDTEYHLSNYKPEFMLRLFEGPAKNEEGIFFFDPDIVIKCKWDFFETWAGHGVALVADINGNMGLSHPIRKGWEALLKTKNRSVTTPMQSYINAGFLGVSKANSGFLKVWSEFIEVAIADYGHKKSEMKGHPRSTLFYVADQDALNIAAMCSGYPISEMGSEGMDFIHGGWTMSHATSRPKPWKKNFIKLALAGKSPTLADYQYWMNAAWPINPFKKRRKVIFKRYCLKIASFIGRFYRRY